MLDRKLIATVTVLAVLLVFAVVLPYSRMQQPSPSSSQTIKTIRQPIVPPDQIVSGGPPPDGIPSIDDPKFQSPSQATFLSDNDTVIGIYHDGVAKAYPLLIMVWHEIVNDVVGGTPVAITYCPLCFATLAFVREIDGTAVTFGTTGKLYNNNLVMYDRLTKSYWSQMWGEAIAGNLTGYRLTKLPIDVMSWRDWKSLYPNTLVLSTDTGFSRPYGIDPYAGYYKSPEILFSLSYTLPTFPPKTIVLGLSVDNINKSYPLSVFNQSGILADTIGKQSVMFFIKGQGLARAFDPVLEGRSLNFVYSSSNDMFTDVQTHSVWNYDGVAISGQLQGKALTRIVTINTFWFAWVAFYSTTLVYS